MPAGFLSRVSRALDYVTDERLCPRQFIHVYAKKIRGADESGNKRASVTGIPLFALRDFPRGWCRATNKDPGEHTEESAESLLKLFSVDARTADLDQRVIIVR